MDPQEPNTQYASAAEEAKALRRRINPAIRMYAVIAALGAATMAFNCVPLARADSDPQTVALLTSMLSELVRIREAVQNSQPMDPWD